MTREIVEKRGISNIKLQSTSMLPSASITIDILFFSLLFLQQKYTSQIFRKLHRYMKIELINKKKFKP